MKELVAKKMKRENSANSFNPTLNKKSVKTAKTNNMKPIHERVNDLIKTKNTKINKLREEKLLREKSADPESFEPSFKPQLCKKSINMIKHKEGKSTTPVHQKTKDNKIDTLT